MARPKKIVEPEVPVVENKVEKPVEKAVKEKPVAPSANELVVKTLQMSFSVGFKVTVDKYEPVDFHVSKSRSLNPGEKEEELLTHLAAEVMKDLEAECRTALEQVQGIKARIYSDVSDGEG